jgi:two-component system alkaline phosphatase synthesis response regulator PhoP
VVARVGSSRDGYMPKQRILVVEDEEDIVELLTYTLEREGFEVEAAGTGEAALEAVGRRQPDLVVLDLMLPGIDGLTVCRDIKSNPQTAGTLILILSAKSSEGDVVTGLDIGSDDYMTKPFSPTILAARVRTLLRRKGSPGSSSGSGGGGGVPAGGGGTEDEAIVTIRGKGTESEPDLYIHPGRFDVRVRGESVKLTPTEFKVLQLLAQRPGWVFQRYQIVNAVKGPDYPVTERAVDVQIVGLRRKLGDFGNYIETVRGVGYRFRETT